MPLQAADTAAAGAQLMQDEDKQPGCCKCCPPENADVSLDGDALAAMRKAIDPAEVADLDIYVSSLNAPRVPGVEVVKEFGLITATYTRVKKVQSYQGSYEQRVRQWAAENALEAETARALALGSLRSKAKSAGANAILSLAWDCETEEGPGGPGGLGGVGMTIMIATGTAVLLAGDLSGLALPPDDKHCLYAGAYERYPGRGAAPLEMERGGGQVARA